MSQVGIRFHKGIVLVWIGYSVCNLCSFLSKESTPRGRGFDLPPVRGVAFV